MITASSVIMAIYYILKSLKVIFMFYKCYKGASICYEEEVASNSTAWALTYLEAVYRQICIRISCSEITQLVCGAYVGLCCNYSY